MVSEESRGGDVVGQSGVREPVANQFAHTRTPHITHNAPHNYSLYFGPLTTVSLRWSPRAPPVSGVVIPKYIHTELVGQVDVTVTHCADVPVVGCGGMWWEV